MRLLYFSKNPWNAPQRTWNALWAPGTREAPLERPLERFSPQGESEGSWNHLERPKGSWNHMERAPAHLESSGTREALLEQSRRLYLERALAQMEPSDTA